MRLLIGALLLGMVPLADSPALSAVLAQASLAEAKLAKSRALVELINPTPLLIESNVKAWEAAFAYALTLNPAIVTLEGQYPGISKAAIAAARPIARHYGERLVVDLAEHKSKLFAERLDSAELDALTTFYASPAGKRLVVRVIGNIDLRPLGKDLGDQAAASGEASFSAEQMRGVERQAIRTSMGKTSADDLIAIMRFEQNPVAAKFQAVVREAEGYALERANNPDPEWMRKQTEAANAALLAFVDARNKAQ